MATLIILNFPHLLATSTYTKALAKLQQSKGFKTLNIKKYSHDNYSCQENCMATLAISNLALFDFFKYSKIYFF